MRLALILLSLSQFGNPALVSSILPPDYEPAARAEVIAYPHGLEDAAEPQIADEIQPDPESTAPPPPWPEPLWQYEDTIHEAADYYHLPPAVIAAIVWRESGGHRESVSRVGAIGLMGILPGYHHCASFNPTANIWCGSGILSRFRNNVDGDLRAALAAYNAGETGRDVRGLGWDYAKLILRIAENFGYVD